MYYYDFNKRDMIVIVSFIFSYFFLIFGDFPRFSYIFFEFADFGYF